VTQTSQSLPDVPIDEAALVVDLLDLLRIPSVSGTAAELEVQEYLVERWRTEDLDVDRWDIDVAALSRDPQFPGMEVERTAAVGVTATLAGDGTGPVLLFNGHTDVVPPGDLDAWTGDPFIPRRMTVDGRDRIVGRGACDMKAGVAAMWTAVRAVKTAGIPLRGSVVLAPVSGEEDGGLGTFALLRHGVTADMCVVPEPTAMDIIPANGGALTFRLTVRGLATHASRRTEGVSAIEKLYPVLLALQELEQRRNAEVDVVMQRWPLAYPLSIGTVHAGDWASTVPDLLTAEGRLGVALGETNEEARAALEAAVAAVCANDPWLAEHPVEVTWWGGQFASGRTPADSPVIGLVSDVHRGLHGRDPEVYGGPYGSDLRLLMGLGGIPTVQYGPGDAAAAHAPDEWVDLDEVTDTARGLVRLILQVCG
jgi:acetylornithine deacetylase